MSTETAKKRGRPKRAALEDAATVVVTKAPGSAGTVAVRAKKTRVRKEDAEGVENVAAGSANTTKASKIKKIPKVSEGSTSVSSSSSKTKTNSKRTAAAAAKKSADVNVKPPSTEATASPPLPEERSWSIILEQARAFSTTSRTISEQVHELVESRKGQLERRGESGTESAAASSASVSTTPATTKTTTTTTTTTMPTPNNKPQSTFVSSFLNDPEPTPTPPAAQSRRKLDEYSIDEPTEPQANADMISSAPSSLQQQQQQQQQSPSLSTSPANTNVNGPPFIESIPQLRAYTTTSFKALKGTSSASPASALSFSSSSFKTLKADASTSASATSTTTQPSTATSSQQSQSQQQPPRQPPRPSISRPPTAEGNRTQGRRVVRPTEMPYEQLVKTSEFRQKRRQWTGFIVAAPIAIVLSYELWRRWQVESERRVEEARRITSGGGGSGSKGEEY